MVPQKGRIRRIPKQEDKLLISLNLNNH